jgi:branched-chain amino acid transport system substrate-binding protein
MQFTGSGTFPIHTEIKEILYAKGLGSADSVDKVGQQAYNRGLMAGILLTEAMSAAMIASSDQPVTGKQMQWALDRLDITAERIAEMGATGMMDPIKLSCADHAGQGRAKMTQWDGNAWVNITDWIEPNDELLWDLYKASAAQYAAEKGITPRSCN